MQKLVEGDVVCLKSHPTVPMTVEFLDEGQVGCVWLNQKLESTRDGFAAAALELYEQGSSTVTTID